jgi:hypothetical protein
MVGPYKQLANLEGRLPYPQERGAVTSRPCCSRTSSGEKWQVPRLLRPDVPPRLKPRRSEIARQFRCGAIRLSESLPAYLRSYNPNSRIVGATSMLRSLAFVTDLQSARQRYFSHLLFVIRSVAFITPSPTLLRCHMTPRQSGEDSPTSFHIFLENGSPQLPSLKGRVDDDSLLYDPAHLLR